MKKYMILYRQGDLLRMKKIKERTYLKKFSTFIIGLVLGWFVFLFIFASGEGVEPLTDFQGKLAWACSLLTMIIFELVSEFNYLKKLELTSASLKSNISVYKERERKLLSKAEEIVFKFFQHESDIQKSVTSLRSGKLQEGYSEEKDNNGSVISLKDLKVTVESYPDLKSDNHISKILNQLEESQNIIMNSKVRYNEYVSYYNVGIASFPSTILSGLWKLKPLKFYVDDDIDDIDV